MLQWTADLTDRIVTFGAQNQQGIIKFFSDLGTVLGALTPIVVEAARIIGVAVGGLADIVRLARGDSKIKLPTLFGITPKTPRYGAGGKDTAWKSHYYEDKPWYPVKKPETFSLADPSARWSPVVPGQTFKAPEMEIPPDLRTAKEAEKLAKRQQAAAAKAAKKAAAAQKKAEREAERKRKAQERYDKAQADIMWNQSRFEKRLAEKLSPREQESRFGGMIITAEQGQQLATQFKQNMTPLQQAMIEYGTQMANVWNTLSEEVTNALADMFVGVVKNTGDIQGVMQNFLQSIADTIVGLLAKLAAVWATVFVLSGFNPTAAGNAVAAVLSQYGAPAAAPMRSPVSAPTGFGPTRAAANFPPNPQTDFFRPFAVGTPFVPRDMMAYIHRGERIIPAGENKRQMEQTTVTQALNRPVEVFVDFGPGEMLRLSKKIDQASYRRSVTGR
jgi:hypothetical protein